MTKTITRVGNSQGIIFDAALMDLARVKVGDQVNVTVVPESGAIKLTHDSKRMPSPVRRHWPGKPGGSGNV